MLIEFSVGNYKSFKEITTFSMVAAHLKAKDETLDENNVFAVDEELKLLKSAVMYGANASGKSNFVTAVNFMREMVLNSSKNTQANEPINIEPFLLSSETEGEPAHFEMVFRLDGRVYRYGFEVDKEGIVKEWLFYVPKTRETQLFMRGDSDFLISGAFKEGKKLIKQTRSNALFLSVVAQFNGPLAIKILQWFKDLIVVSGLDHIKLRRFTLEAFAHTKYKEFILELIKELDTGIWGIQIDQEPFDTPIFTENVNPQFKIAVSELIQLTSSLGIKQDIVKTTHIRPSNKNQATDFINFDMDKQESAGTNQIFSLAGLFAVALKEGKVLIIDELNARLHTLITQKLVALFNSNQTNPHNAQLVFTTHDTNLLSKDIFRRDQIWFAEKNQVHSTVLYSLAEFKIRNDASFEKDYILGRYGAIPFIGDLTDLWGE